MTLRQAFLTGLILLALSFQVLVLVILAFFPYVPDPGFSSLDTNIYAFLAPLSTIFLLGLLYAWLIRLGTREGVQHSHMFKRLVQFLGEPFRQLRPFVRARSLPDSAMSPNILSRPRLMLTVSVVASIFLGFVPYRPDINPTGRLVGIDTPVYAGWVNQMLQRPIFGAVGYA